LDADMTTAGMRSAAAVDAMNNTVAFIIF